MDHLRRGLARRAASSTPAPAAAVQPAPEEAAPLAGPAPATPASMPPASSLFPAHLSLDQVAGSPCRHLGLRDDPSTHFAYPSPLNRCHASGQPEPADGAYQAGRCLNESHRGCPRYAAAERAAEVRAAAPARRGKGSGAVRGAQAGPPGDSRETGIATGSVGGAVAIDEAPPSDSADAARAGSPRTQSTARQVLRYLLLLVVMLVLGFALAVALLLLRPGSLGGFLVDSSRAPASPAAQVPPAASLGAAASAAPTSSAMPNATAPPTPAATVAASTSPAPTSRPSTPARSARPSAAAPPRRLIYYVQRGDTLISIATRFGVTVDVLRQANGLAGSLLQVGQQLIIPLR